MKPIFIAAIASTAFLALASAPASAQEHKMSFFVTSVGGGDGANLGGLEGADAHCQMLAAAAGAGDMTWRAYLSATGVNAKDRIGMGPWHNAKGETIAMSVAELHSDANMMTKALDLDEKGEVVNGRGDSPNKHDMLTGSNPDGTLADGKTCADWTSNDQGSTIVGHSDRMGLADDAPSKSWNSSHETRGCSQQGLVSTGGDGLFYCFASDAMMMK